MTTNKSGSTPTYSRLLVNLGRERFFQVLASSPRQAKETYFAQFGIRAPKAAAGKLNLPGHKNQARSLALLEALNRNEDDQLSEEILRRHMLTQRALLGAALDHIGVKHEGGLSESEDVSKLGRLSKDQRAALLKDLTDKHVASAEDIALYLDFMAVSSKHESQQG